MSDIIKAENLIHSYEGSAHRSLDQFSLSVRQGEFLALLGHNGSGKSTLARHLNALLEVQQGELTVAFLDAKNPANVWKIREKAGMVFQNPDNQFVSSIVEEDLAFGPRNFDVPEEEIPARIERALVAVGMDGYEKHSTHLLSGGQKQRLAIAGVLTVEPDLLIFAGGTYSVAAWASGYFVTALPGIVIQLVLLPSIVFALMKARLIPARYPEE